MLTGGTADDAAGRRGGYAPLPTADPDGAENRRDSVTLTPRTGEHYRALVSSVKLLLEDPSSSTFATGFHYSMVFVIVGSVLISILETEPSLSESAVLFYAEHVFNVFFYVEIGLRYWTSESTLSFFSSGFNVLDIVATCGPAAVEAFIAFSARGKMADQEQVSDSLNALRVPRMVRIFRLIRVLRLAKAIRNSEAITIVIESVWGSSDGLFVLVTFLLMGMVCMATGAYIVEVDQTGTKFASIPASMWWSASTIMAVGYGDMIPETFAGRFLALSTMLLGNVIVSICIAIITTSFTELYQRKLHARHLRNMVLHGDDNPEAVDLAACFASHETAVQELMQRFEACCEVLTEESSVGNPVARRSSSHGAFRLMSKPGVPDSMSTDIEHMMQTVEFLWKSNKCWFEQARSFSEKVLTTTSSRQPNPRLSPLTFQST